MTKIDLTNIEHIKGILKTHGAAAKKALGQNFLVDRNALDKIIEAGELNHDDQVLEIGPGLGVLTDAILNKTMNLTSLEMDREIIPILQINMHNLHSTEELKDWEVIHTDALKFDIDQTNFKKGYKLIANIPYFITSPLLRHFLKDQYVKATQNNTKANDIITPSIIVFLIQKEVAEKITDKKKESVIGLNIKVFGEPEIIATVPASSFHPAPKVDSAVLKITVHRTPLIDMAKVDINKFFETIERGFASPRKKLRNNIPEELILKANIDPNLRAEKLTIEDWVKITEAS